MALRLLGTSVDSIERVDLLIFLMGRVLQIVEDDREGNDVEQEGQQIARAAVGVLGAEDADDIYEAALDVLRYLPARSADEINFVLDLSRDKKDERIRSACAYALRYARPKMAAAWAALEAGRQSEVQSVRSAVEEALKRRK